MAAGGSSMNADCEPRHTSVERAGDAAARSPHIVWRYRSTVDPGRTIMTRTTISAIALALFGTCIAGGAMAQTPWQQNHPGRTEVNHRLANQNARIHQEVSEGKLSLQQARVLHRDDRQIRTEERFMASQNGTHLTRQEWSTLNNQENAVSQQIGR
jgi:hypothetical protein